MELYLALEVIWKFVKSITVDFIGVSGTILLLFCVVNFLYYSVKLIIWIIKDVYRYIKDRWSK